MEWKRFKNLEHYSDYINHAVWCSNLIDEIFKINEPCTVNELKIKTVTGNEVLKQMMDRFEKTFYRKLEE
jgi:methyl coenzyme M reductase alpha subunit